MAQADSVPIANPAPITGATSNSSTRRVPAVGRRVDQTSPDPTPVSANFWPLCYATATILLGCWSWDGLLILLLLLCKSSRRGSSV